MAGSTVGNGNEALLTYYRDIVRQMMFASEDFEDPIPACIELVLDITKYQMVKALEDARQHANAPQRKIITLEDFAIAAERVNELKRAAPRTAKLDEGKEEESDMEEDEIPTISVPETNINRMKSTVESMDFKETAGQLLEMLSPVYEERKKRIASFESEITPEKYFRFTETRQATFRDDFKQVLKKKNDAANLLRWLGAPQCEPVVSFVLAFIGREVVAQFVDAAVAIRNFEDPKLFLNDDRHGHVAGPNEKVPLQVRHYNEVLRRCIGWRRRKDFLLGYYEDAEENKVNESSQSSNDGASQT
ncbi:hypothetical protein Y032_0017g3378 [Ancylostoma ceylanicum]|uniref:Transcription initiation factor IID, subunit n=1 Tax=Ancylostoma ceylanicum TaxID=53326 RepID=A0A016V5F9_9BILA|nr:hypothetical protein Y032_0017g3378 [Ancylostoma ceylanicum]